MSNEEPKPFFAEPHYTCEQLHQMTGVGASTLRRWFYDEPGVLRIESRSVNPHKKAKVHLRIPLHVAERVYRRYVQGGLGGKKSA